jgi:hypothetical protein
MSGTFDERRKGFEEKWAHDEEMRFKVVARRDKLLGEWAARELGLKGPQMESYAKAIVSSDVGGGESEILRKLRADFDLRKVAHSDHMIRRQMDELLKLAGEQVMSERKK